ncbi:MAG: DNA/RNA non-specific endonuclease [Bacteroidetes bacterium]|nr:MAG: DNA/RNA non-specific endonuclease [Bacteroidota bacterium]RLD68903.1 MAG: DNA/RNA non-specific endonuclease [Bacteroidota bacterium]RLD91902.1 MAG: DNA/RNA non-specific endonuclease [Bacteroidota bacterium]RLD98288.1 MAG: DNA/RNA non-specific endonuclease [Bacteroidota bacterium]
MSMTKKERWGLIAFIILIIASILVTTEPWKRSTAEMRGALEPEAPPTIAIKWIDLALGYPLAHTGDTILTYTGFHLAYNEQFEQAAWVAYVLTRDEIESGTIERTNNFRSDTSIASGSASPADYRRSGFDRGHLAPAGDMKWDHLAMSQSFLMSNMSPQRPSFNRGIWRKLETKVRNWAMEKDSIYVITGPLFSPGDSLIGENGVGVPGHYFKVLVDLSPPDHDMIAFLLPNSGSSEDLIQFAITVDSLEQLTGYDFFSVAPDQEMIEWLEQRIEPGNWN